MKTRYTTIISIFIFFALIGGSSNFVYGQGENDITDLDNLSLESLLDITVVSASRHEQKVMDSPRAVSVITAKELREKNYRSTPEALNELVGVQLQETNYGGGSVILRGLIGNQVLILVDGVRLNNAIYRLGPNQYLNTIDINQIERIEVVKGAGSVLYGSDALGGLVNIITKSKAGTGGKDANYASAFGRYSTADNGTIGRVELGKQFENFNVYGGASIKKFHNLEGGRNTGLQNFTGYNEWDADFKIGYSPNEDHNLAVGFQHVNQTNVPRTDKLFQKTETKMEWDPQLRDLAFFDYNFQNVTSFIDNFSTKLYYQNQSEKLYRITSSKTNVEREYFDRVNTVGATFQLSSSINENHLFTYGADFTFDKITSNRNDVDLITGVSSAKTGNYANDSKYHTFAIFVQDEIQITERLSANLGLRYNSYTVQGTVSDKSTGTLNVDINPNALVGSGYLMYKMTEDFNISFGVAQGFRAPNIDDATFVGSSSGSFEIPNPNLQPEKSLNYELGFKYNNEVLYGSLFLFYSDFNGLIQREPALYNGKSYIDANNNGQMDSGEENVMMRNNIGKAGIYGFEFEGKYNLSNNLNIHGNIAWVKGEDKFSDEPLTRIPPLQGIFGVKWRIDKNVWFEYYNLYAVKQTKLSPSDIKDSRIPEGGTPGYLTYNLRGGYNLDNFGRITLGLENITNASYRLHASGLDSPGFNIVFGYDIVL